MDNSIETPVATPETPPADADSSALVSPQTPPQPDEQTAVVVIPRVMFNYVVIALVFLALGLVIGLVGYDRIAQQDRMDTESLISKVVATAVAAIPGNSAAAAPDPNARVTVAIDGEPSMGPANAPVVMVEFGDFHCQFCKRFHDDTITPLLQHYGDKILYVFRDFPILGPDSLSAALAAGCADDQHAFWPFHDRLFADSTELTRDKFLQYASDLGMNVDTFTQCYDMQQHQAQVLKDYNDGENLGVGGTPTFFINGKILVGAQPYDQFVTRIDQELAAADESQSPS